MSVLDGVLHRLRVLLRGEGYARETEREIRFHVELESLQQTHDGLAQRDAELVARKTLGNVTYYREEVRRMTPIAWFDGLGQDLRYAWRGIRRSPGFAVTVIVTIALGLGVNAAMFSLLDHLLMQPPAGIARPNEVRRLYFEVSRQNEPGGRIAYDYFPYLDVRAITIAEDSGLAIAAYMEPDSVLVVDGKRQTAGLVSLASQKYFSVLGLRPALGRFFTHDEEQIEIPTRTVVISDAFWHRAFNADRRVLGRTIRFRQHPYVIVGVASPDFAGIDLDRADLWAPMNTAENSSGMPGPWYESFANSFRMIARLRAPGEERHVLDVATNAVRAVHIPHLVYDSTARVLTGPVVRALGPMKRDQEITVAARIGGVSVIVLLIAAANVANLLLLRATRRKREIAVRRALGVSQARLMRQLAVESTVLILLGGAAAAVLAIWVGAALRRLVMPHVVWAGGALDARTITFVVVTSLVIGVVTGLAPAAQAKRFDLAASLKAGTRDAAYQRSRLRSALLAFQAALCTILLVGTGLFVRSLGNMESVSTGYAEIDNVLLVRLMFDDEQRHTTEVAAALPGIAQRLATLDGVAAAAYASVSPLSGASFHELFLPGRAELPQISRDFGPSVTSVSPDYFRATGIAIRHGRSFAATDVATGPRVVIVSETMARAYWPGQDALGRCIVLDKRENPCSTVVGVAADAHRFQIIEQPVGQFYLPAAQDPGSAANLIVRVQGGRAIAVRRDIDQILRQALPNVASTSTKTMFDVLEPQLRPWRLGATLFAALGGLAVLVAAVGIYSVVAYGVSQRTHEMGVRIALGARASDILDVVLADSLGVVAVGIGIGIVSSLLLGRLVASLLFGITSSDPSVLIAAITGLCALGTIASLVPAWRATRVDPATTLRNE